MAADRLIPGRVGGVTGALGRVRPKNELAPARGGRRPLARAHRSGGVPRHPSSAWDRPPTASRTSAGAKLARLVGRRRLLGGAATKLQRAAWHAARRLAPVRGRGRAPRVPGQPARSSERSRAAVCGGGGDLSPRSSGARRRASQRLGRGVWAGACSVLPLLPPPRPGALAGACAAPPCRL